MSAQIINGREMARQIYQELKQEIAELKEKHNLIPGLATILVGDDPASQVYVKQKEEVSHTLGIHWERDRLPADITEEELIILIGLINRDPNIHGILVQLPLPGPINESRVIYAINPKKDVDGFHPINLGKLMTGEPNFLPCTPHAIQELLIRSRISVEGKEVVVIGRSNIFFIANLLVQKRGGANAIVTMCHTQTGDISSHTKRADILIVAIGKPKVITADMVKQGVVVIDVGINRIGKSSSGKAILVGDVDFDSVKEKAKAITPVPGGVGPMTVAMVMLNTVKAAKLAAGLVKNR